MGEYSIIKGTINETHQDKDLLLVKTKNEEILTKIQYTHLYPGDTLYLFGKAKFNKVMGHYFEADFYREVIDLNWMAKWLKLKKGMSDKGIIDRLIYRKGMATVWDDIENIQKTKKILNYLKEKYKIDEKDIAKIESTYRWDQNRIPSDPYLLLKVGNVPFHAVKDVIKTFHCEGSFKEKGSYYVTNLLKQGLNRGHFYLPKKRLIEAFEEKHLKLKDELSDETLVEEKGRVYLKPYYRMECDIVENIEARLKIKSEKTNGRLIDDWEKENGFSLAKQQKEGVEMALSENFCIVTGGPGVGKTTVCKCIIDLLSREQSVLMVAPTGRAAKRAYESTGLKAKTIHSLLEFDGTAFNRNEENKIETDVLVIDESSMIDGPLLRALLYALPVETKIIFVGDVDQLPSVGPGQILKDLIQSTYVPVTRLTEIFRQAADSPIIDCAYSVNDGKLPKIKKTDDLIYIEKREERDLFNETVKIAKELYERECLFDVQILIPKYKGRVGIDSVNNALQQALNPNKKGVKIKEFEIRCGDKVIQTKNVAQKDIYNGDVGVVTQAEESLIKVKFQGDEKETAYKKNEFEQLQLSYAVTIHRAQGSEYKYTIMPLANEYKHMLQKNLIYTGITRAKKKLYIIYQMDAFKKGVSLDSVPKRYTSIKEMLMVKKQPF